MRILSWNIRGLSSDLKKKVLRKQIRELGVDMLTVQETKMERCEEKHIASLWPWGNYDWVCCQATGFAGGLLMVWDKNSFLKSEVFVRTNYVVVKGRWEGHEFEGIMVNVYAP